MSLYHAQGRLIWLIAAAQSKLNPFSPIEVAGLEHTFKSLYCMLNVYSMYPIQLTLSMKEQKLKSKKRKNFLEEK